MSVPTRVDRRRRTPAEAAQPVPAAAIRRLSLYLRELDGLADRGRSTASSRDLGDACGLSDAQVRKDLAAFGSFGHPGVGYDVTALAERVRHILGTDKTWPCILLGVGNLGRALAGGDRLSGRGFRLAAALDSDAGLIDWEVAPGVRVRPASQLAEAVAETAARIGILAVPGPYAQKVAAEAVEAGLRGILNFTPVRLELPDHVSVVDVDLAQQLEQLAYLVHDHPKDPSAADK
jgi:redox-sensing transcriptional repressor